MSFSCTVQMMGLVREDYPKGRHRGNGKAIIGEMGKERISRSETLDKERTKFNKYDQDIQSGFEVWDEMVERAENYKMPVKCKQKDGTEITRYRNLKKDAVLGVAIIINPPFYESQNWDENTYKKFYEDTQEVLEELNPDIFRKENQIFGVEHYDEGYNINDRHKHIVYNTVSQEGRYCGNKIDAKFLSEFNKKYPKMMRDRGWDMDDLDTTDWDRFKVDQDYRIERKAKRKFQGKSVNQYIHDKVVKNLVESENMIAAVRGLQSDLSRLQQEKVEIQEEIKKQRTAAEDELEEYKKQEKEKINKELEEYKNTIKTEAEKIMAEAVAVKQENEKKQEKLNWEINRHEAVRNELIKVTTELNKLKSQNNPRNDISSHNDYTFGD